MRGSTAPLGLVSFYPQSLRPNQLSGLPEGVDGIRKTLKIMVQLARQYQKDMGVVQLSRDLTDPLPQKDFSGELEALQRFVRDCIRYVRDPEDVELVQTPKATLETARGDCDDKATLLASLLKSIGFPTRFVAVGIAGGPYSHVYVEARLGTRWIPLETIVEGAEPGWSPPDKTRLMVAHV